MVQEDIIELTDVVEDGASEDQEIIELTEIYTGDAVDREETGPPKAEMDGPGDVSDKLAGLGREDLEAALERVIERKFSESIETLLFEVTEKVIQKEIADIKAALQKDLDDIGKS